MRWLQFLIVSVLTVSTCATTKRLLVDQLRWDFLELENSLWSLSENELLRKELGDAENYLAKRFYEYDRQLKQMPSDLLFGVTPLRTLPDFLFLYSNLSLIDVKYTKFKDYLNEMRKDVKDTKINTDDVIYDILNNQTGVEIIVSEVYKLAYDQTNSMKQELYRIIGNNFWCKDLSQSPQQLFYNLYNLIALNTLKAYVMQQFAYLGNIIWSKGLVCFKFEYKKRDDQYRGENPQLSQNARKKFEQRSANIIRGMSIPMKQSNQLWRCDPKTFIQGKNYDEFTRLLQGHIQNEVDMSSRRTCRETCSDYQFTKSHGCYDYESDVCRRTERCHGNIVGCFFVESHATICVSQLPSRRYDFVRYNSGKILGQATSCSNSRTVNSWTRWFVRCHYCMCLCDEEGPKSDRYINLRLVKSNFEQNMVVTGLRLVKHNRILHIQIQEGKLLPYGRIDQESVRWKNVDDYKITDYGVKTNVDFFTMTYEARSMALSEIQVNEEFYVLTGVGFMHLNNKIYLKIHVNSFDWHNGTVKSTSFDIFETSRQTSQYQIRNPDVPIKTPTPSTAHHEDSLKYITFTNSDFDKDAAQTTVPFIDTQEVVSKPAVPLMGAGIYYKGNEGYGGFIAPMIKTYDFYKHLSMAMPPIQNRVLPHTVDVN